MCINTGNLNYNLNYNGKVEEAFGVLPTEPSVSNFTLIWRIWLTATSLGSAGNSSLIFVSGRCHQNSLTKPSDAQLIKDHLGLNQYPWNTKPGKSSALALLRCEVTQNCNSVVELFIHNLQFLYKVKETILFLLCEQAKLRAGKANWLFQHQLCKDLSWVQVPFPCRSGPKDVFSSFFQSLPICCS